MFPLLCFGASAFMFPLLWSGAFIDPIPSIVQISNPIATGCLCERHRKKRGITSVAVNKKNIQLYYLILFILNLNIFYVHTVYTYRTVHLYDNTYHTTTLVPIIDKKSFLRLKR